MLVQFQSIKMLVKFQSIGVLVKFQSIEMLVKFQSIKMLLKFQNHSFAHFKFSLKHLCIHFLIFIKESIKMIWFKISGRLFNSIFQRIPLFLKDSPTQPLNHKTHNPSHNHSNNKSGFSNLSLTKQPH